MAASLSTSFPAALRISCIVAVSSFRLCMGCKSVAAKASTMAAPATKTVV